MIDRSILCIGGTGELGWIAQTIFVSTELDDVPRITIHHWLVTQQKQITDFEIHALIQPIAQFLKVNLEL